MSRQKTRIHTVLITGLSGSGKSTALDTLEDLGFFCVDNLPSALADKFLQMMKNRRVEKLAVAMDARDGHFLVNFQSVLKKFRAASAKFEVIFLEANPRVIQRRFSVTRRRHPLAREGSVTKAIRQETEALKPLRTHADKILDTSRLSVRSLSQEIDKYFTKGAKDTPLEITILSFGFYNGTPEDADLILDVRFLPNPHFEPKLRRFNGRHPSIKRYVLNSKDSRAFLKRIINLLVFLIPRYRAEGKSYLTIGIGCTGGRHRSVVIAEHLHGKLRKYSSRCYLVHRDLGKGP